MPTSHGLPVEHTAPALHELQWPVASHVPFEHTVPASAGPCGWHVATPDEQSIAPVSHATPGSQGPGTQGLQFWWLSQT
jgi:hypothetical protein